MQEELAETFPYFHLLAFSVVGEGICDDCGVVFIDDVVLGVAGGEDTDGSAHGNSGAEEGGCDYVLVVDQGFVHLVKCGIGDGLTGTVASFGMGGGFGAGFSWEVARDLMFSLGVHGRDELRWGRLLPLAPLSQILPSFNVGGVSGLFGWQLWLGARGLGGISVSTGGGVGVRSRVRFIVISVVVVCSLLLPPSLLLRVGVGGGAGPSRFRGGPAYVWLRGVVVVSG